MEYMSWVVALLLGGAAIVAVLLPWGKRHVQVEDPGGKEQAPPPDKKADEVATPKEDERLEVEPPPNPPVVVEVIETVDPPEGRVEVSDQQPKETRKRHKQRKVRV